MNIVHRWQVSNVLQIVWQIASICETSKLRFVAQPHVNQPFRVHRFQSFEEHIRRFFGKPDGVDLQCSDAQSCSSLLAGGRSKRKATCFACHLNAAFRVSCSDRNIPKSADFDFLW